jgi:serine/threonine protein kinase/Leucine-rich repeat (LRR) protein
MPIDPAQKTAILRELLDGSLPPDRFADAERLLEHDPDALTLLNEQDKIETFVSRVREAIAMPNFPEERNEELARQLQSKVLNQVKGPIVGSDTASINLDDPSVSTDSQGAAGSTTSLTFLSPAQSADEIGRLNGYRILRRLGEGGMGLVFEAEDIRLKRRVALKVMKPEVAAKEAHRVRFLREAQTAAQVEHDHICPIYQVGEDNGIPFIAMPFLKGEPLDALLKRQKQLPIDEAMRIAREVAEGLAVAHDAGLVHRDIKPANIWLETISGRPSRVRILDFGLARLQTDETHLTATGAIMGTPAYMAPEQARSKPVDHRADLFSLGVMLYEMTTGRRPFAGADTMSILTSLAIDDPTAPSLINFSIPAELSDLILNLLAKSPEKRPQNARAVANAITAILLRNTKPIVEAMPNGSGERDGEFDFDRDDATNVDVPRVSAAVSGSPTSAKRKRRGGLLIAAAIAILFFIGASFGAYKLFFETANGTLIVEVDKDADVRFRDGKLEIHDEAGTLLYTLEPDEANKTLPPGKYTIHVVGAEGLTVNTPEFRLKKGDTTKVYVIVDRGWKPGNDPKKEATEPIDLLALIDPKRDAVTGRWKIVDGSLNGGGSSALAEINERLEIPFTPPAEYDLQMEVERLGSIGNAKEWNQRRALILILKGQKRFQVILDSSDFAGNVLNGLQKIDGKKFDGNESTTTKNVIANARRVARVEVHVRTQGVRVTVNGEKLFDWLGDASRLSPDEPFWGLRTPDTIGLGVQNAEYRIHKLLFAPAGSSDDPDRRAAEWVLKNFGAIRVNDRDGPELKAGATLPREAFRLTAVNLNRNGRITDAGLAIFKDCKSLTWLGLANTPVTNSGLAFFKDCKNLTHLDLAQTKIANTGLAVFRGCTKLTELDISGTLVSDVGMQYLKDCKKLTRCDFRTSKVTAAGINELKAILPQCRIQWDGGVIEPSAAPDADRKAAEWALSVGGEIVLAPWQQINEAKELPAGQFRIINIDLRQKEKVDDAGLLHLKDLAELQALNLLRAKITDGGLLHLKDLKKLESLELNGTRITDGGLATIKGLPNLKWLSLSWTDVTDAALVHIKTMANLEELTIDGTKISEAGLVHLTALPKLRGLVISLPLNERVTAHLKALSKLTSLGITYQPNDDCLTHLKALPQLTELTVGFSQVSNAGLARLSVLPNLVTLSLRGTPVGDAGVEHLKALTKLTSLFLPETKVTAAGIDGLKKALPQCKIVWDGGVIEPSAAPDADRKAAEWVLAIGGVVKINEKGKERDVKAAGDLPKGAYQLLLIYLGNNEKLSDADLARLKDCNNLTWLDLSNTDVTAAGLAHLKDCKKLTAILLESTDVSDSAVAPLESCKNLTQLYLAKTKFTAAGIDELKKALPECKIKWDGGVIEPSAAVHAGLQFDGATNYVDIPTLSRDADYPITIEGWITVNGTRGANLVRIEGKSPCQMHGWPGANAATEWVPNGMDQRGVKCGGGTPALTPGKRAHVAVEIDDKMLYLFIDGTKVNSVVRDPGDGNGNLTGAIIGAGLDRNKNSPVAVFSGAISEIRISKVIRYTQEFTPANRHEPDKDTLALYHCDEGAGERLTDSSGNGHHGNIVGAKWVKAAELAVKPQPVAAPLSAEQRKTLEWALSIGGKCGLQVNNVEVGLQKGSQIPDGDIRLSNVFFSGIKTFDDSSIDKLKNMPPITSELWLDGTSVTDVGLAKLTTIDSVRGLYGILLPPQCTEAGLVHLAKFPNLYHVQFSGTKLADSWIGRLKTIPKLSRLEVNGTAITDAGVKAIGELTGINDLSLSETTVTDAGLASLRNLKLTRFGIQGCKNVTGPGLENLKDMTTLQSLHAEHSNIGDAGLAHLKSLTSLENLSLGATRVTSNGMTTVGGFTNLKSLDLYALPITNDGLARLEGLTNLEILGMDGAKVNDNGLKRLHEMKRLRTLYIINSPNVGDAGLNSLVGLTELRELNITGTKVTKAGVDKLAAALPKCKIAWDGGTIQPK